MSLLSPLIRKVPPQLPSRDPVMSQSQIKFAFSRRQRQRTGLTLVELLVAISILVIIAAILVPQLRFATADRKIREASRLVATLFAQASQRAINDGEAGVIIERNPNITEGGGFYAGTSLFLMRKVPRYTGETGDVAEIKQLETTGNNRMGEIYIPIPPEQTELNTIQAGDHITFNGVQNIQFEITDDPVIEKDEFGDDKVDKLLLKLIQPTDFLKTQINPRDIFFEPNNLKEKILGTFTIYRQPRKLVSSRVDLPAGFLIDLRVSGETDTSGNSVLFNLDNRNRVEATTAAPNSVGYTFNRRGAIDQVFYTITQGTNFNVASKIPSEPAYLMVREYRPEDGSEITDELLGLERYMWVTVDPDNGAANVVSGIPVNTSDFGTLRDALAVSRGFNSEGQQAAQ